MKNRKIPTALFASLFITLLNGCSDPLEPELTAILQNSAGELGKLSVSPLVRMKIKSVNITDQSDEGSIFIVASMSINEEPGVVTAESAIKVSYEAEIEYLDKCYMQNSNLFACSPYPIGRIHEMDEVPKGTIMIGKGELFLSEEKTGLQPMHLVTDLKRSESPN